MDEGKISIMEGPAININAPPAQVLLLCYYDHVLPLASYLRFPASSGFDDTVASSEKLQQLLSTTLVGHAESTVPTFTPASAIRSQSEVRIFADVMHFRRLYRD